MKFLNWYSGKSIFDRAGLYSHYENKLTSEVVKTFTIRVRETNKLLSEIHTAKKRIPIVLHPTDQHKWLQLDTIEKFAFKYEVDLIAHNLEGKVSIGYFERENNTILQLILLFTLSKIIRLFINYHTDDTYLHRQFA